MDIGGRGEAGCGIGGRIILLDLGRGMREGIGEVVKGCMPIGKVVVSEIRRSTVTAIVVSSCNRVLMHFFHDKWRLSTALVCVFIL